MMKFDRIYRNGNETIVYVVMVDQFNRRVELWRWAAGAGDAVPPVVVKAIDYHDYTGRFAAQRTLRDEAKALSRLAS